MEGRCTTKKLRRVPGEAELMSADNPSVKVFVISAIGEYWKMTDVVASYLRSSGMSRYLLDEKLCSHAGLT